MADTIRDGTGQGYLAKVNKDNQISVKSESESIQHTVSRNKQQAYQVIGTATLKNGTTNALHICNDASDKDLIVTYIRHQVIGQSGGTAFPNVSNYFKVSFGESYSTGGTEVTPVNVNKGSGNDADVTVYDNDPTLIGTATEIDRWYSKEEGDMNVLTKEGAVIIQPGRCMTLSYVGDQTAGTIYTRLSFLMKERGD